MSEKLQKVLADRGLGSRRAMEKWIAAGRVGINGRAAKLGDRVEPDDEVSVDGRKLDRGPAARTRVLVLNKRAGIIVSRHDPERRASVFDELPSLRTGRWISVGRLDIQTTGLLLVTNNGALANRLMHPSTGIDREYAVRVNGTLEPEAEAALRAGVTVGGRTESFSDIRYYDGRGTNHWYHVVLMEGRNREVRELFATQGLKVTRLEARPLRSRDPPALATARCVGGNARRRCGRATTHRRRRGTGASRSKKGQSRARSDRTKGRTMLIPYPELRPGQTP